MMIFQLKTSKLGPLQQTRGCLSWICDCRARTFANNYFFATTVIVRQLTAQVRSLFISHLSSVSDDELSEWPRWDIWSHSESECLAFFAFFGQRGGKPPFEKITELPGCKMQWFVNVYKELPLTTVLLIAKQCGAHIGFHTASWDCLVGVKCYQQHQPEHSSSVWLVSQCLQEANTLNQ